MHVHADGKPGWLDFDSTVFFFSLSRSHSHVHTQWFDSGFAKIE